MPQSATASLQRLKNALAEVLVDKPMSEVTVQDIVRKAEVGRSTFYRHFLDLADFYSWLQKDMLATIIAQFDMEAEQIEFINFYQYAQGHRILLQSFLKNRQWPEFTEQLYAVVLSNYLKVLQKQPNAVPVRIRTEFLIGGQINLFQWWLGEKNPPTPAEMAAYHKKLTAPD